MKASDFVIEIADVVEWLKGMPQSGQYTYEDTHRCAICKYLKAQGLKNVVVIPNVFKHTDAFGNTYTGEIPKLLNEAAVLHFTFGGMLKYLENELRYA